MAKFYGEIGYATLTLTSPGVWEDVIETKNYYGDVTRISKRDQKAEKLNDDIVVNNVISIIADPFANANFFKMRYVKWNGVKWKISDVEVQRPRLILTIGGVYNGK